MTLTIARISFATACISLASLAASCVPTPTNNEPPNALVANPRSLTITNSVDSLESSVALNCGCTFQLGVAASGDTAHIHFQPDTLLTAMKTPHKLRFYINPATPGLNDSAKYVLKTFDDNTHDYFYDTITVHAILP